MAEPKQLRNSNIELLRIVLMLFVVTLHFNGMGANALNFAEQGSFNSIFLNWLEAIAVCAVDCFMIISGYFLANNKSLKINRIINLLLIVIGSNLFSYFCSVIFGTKGFSVKTLILYFIPLNYYFTLYTVTYILSPFVNFVFDKLETKKNIKIFFLIVIILFVIYPTVFDLANNMGKWNFLALSTVSTNSGYDSGYTIVNFITMYIIGAFLKRNEIKFKSWKLALCLLANTILLTTFWILKIESIRNSYCSLFVVLNAVLIFLLFNNLNFNSKVINFISRSTFAIFCLHTTGFINELWKLAKAEQIIHTYKFGGLIAIPAVLVMFVFCFLIDISFGYLIKLFNKLLLKTKWYNFSYSFEER